MDPQGLLLLAVFLLLTGRAMNDLLIIFRLTKVVIVRGGEVTDAVKFAGHVTALAGFLLLVAVTITRGDFVFGRFACFFGE